MIYLDANVIIRFIEGDAAARDPIRKRLQGVGRLATSQLSRLECRCAPLRDGDTALLAVYDTFFRGVELTLIELDVAVVDRATELRARHGFKSPDALHLASAIVGGATPFLTGDTRLAWCKDVLVEIL